MSQQPSTSAAAGSRPNTGDFKEFNFRFPQTQKKKYSVMQFNRNDNVDLSKWQQAKMERENNKIHYKTDVDDLPKSGAGSEFGRERREEARLRKYGIISQKYKEEDQPWILKRGGPDGKTAKKYRGRKEGRVNENSSYFILSQLADGTFEAYPVDSWYNFIAMQTYKTLNAEEAEEEFGRRDKTMNFFSVMVQKKLRDNKDDEDKEEAKGTKGSKDSDLTLVEEDYFLSEDDEMDDSDDDGGGKSKSKKKGKGKKGKKPAKKRPKKKDDDSEAEEESDEGDFDGREFDYISEQSSDDDDVELAKTDIKGLDQELQQMEDEEEEDEEEEGEGKNESKEGEKLDDSKEGKEKKSDDSSSDSSGSDSDIDEKNIQSALLLQKKHGKKSSEKPGSKTGSSSHSRSQTPTVPETSAVTDLTLTDAAKKLESKDPTIKKRPSPTESPANKRQRTESPVPGASASKTPSGHVPLTEEEVKRYLMRRPMTTKDLLVKLNPKRTGLPKEQIENKLTEILVRLAPEKRKKENKIYWFIRENSK